MLRISVDDAKSIQMINEFIDMGFQVVVWPDRHKDSIEVRLYSGEWTTGYQRLPRSVNVSGSSVTIALEKARKQLKEILRPH